MAKGDTKTNQYLDIAANGTRADLPTDTCCETRSQTLIREVAERIMDVEDEVEEIKNNPDVVDIVATYADLQAYDTQHLTDKDIIRVLQDETHDGESTYYRYNKQSDTWTYVGESKQYEDFVGTDGTTAGEAGLVPAPATTDAGKFLSASGLWEEVAGGGITELTSADYNYPVNNPDGVARWLLDPGYYECGETIKLYYDINTSGSTDTAKFWVLKDSYDRAVIVSPSGGYLLLNSIKSDGTTVGEPYQNAAVLTASQTINNLTSTDTFLPLSANQGRVLKNLVDSLAVRASGAPTTSTVGQVGTLYEDTTNGKLYQCTAVSGNTYTWTEVGAGGSGPTVVQTTGTSTTDVMSQDATTSMVFADPSTTQKVQIGNSASAGGNNSVAVGYGASSGGTAATAIGRSANSEGSQSTAVGFESVARGTNAVALGHGATGSVGKDGTVSVGASAGANSGNASYSTQVGYFARATSNGGIALGSYSSASAVGEMNIGSTSTNYGYNSSNYRLLTGLYDGQSAHDAATKGQLDSIAIQNAGVPTAATVGTVGQLLEDTTNGKLYICTDATNPYVWEEVGAGGGGGPTVVQTTGTSTTDVMSQNATSSMVFANPSSKTQVQIGDRANAGANTGNATVAIGNSAKAYQYGGDGSSAIYPTAVGPEAVAKGNRSLALGANSSATYTGSVAVGAGANATSVGQFDIGTLYGSYGYNSSNYRLLTGVYDPQSAHDAATKGYVDPTTDSSAPTTATVGRLGQIQIDTTTATAYMCVEADDVTPSYTWKQITA